MAATPGTPLFALSPDKMNQQRLPFDHKHSRSSSDVASKVAFLNSLNNSTSPTRQQHATSHAALQRAILGREEAEAALSTATSQLAEAQIRELRISERVESLMEELQALKERQVHERQVFEKEVRRARKEAFKVGSTVVKVQEELKEARDEAKALKADVHHERSGKEKSRQEAFDRAYTLAGILEEVQVLRERLRTTEAERDAALLGQQALTIHQEEQSARTVTESAVPNIEDQQPEQSESTSASNLINARPSTNHAQQTSPHQDVAKVTRRNRFERLLPVETPESTRFVHWSIQSRATADPEITAINGEDTGSVDEEADIEEQMLDLQAELRWERKLRERADDMVHFLQMECQFKMCACRIAEQAGERFIHDWDYERKLRAESAERKEKGRRTGDEEVQQSIVIKEADANAPFSDDVQLAPKTTTQPDTLTIRSHSATPGMSVSDPPAAHAKVRPDEDLFNLSPPKQAPPRPATAMGTMNVHSPIRVVARSPFQSQTLKSVSVHGNGFVKESSSTPGSTRTRSPSASPFPVTPGLKTPVRLFSRTVQAHTTTTMVPLRGFDDEDVSTPAAENIPGTPISREAALAQIRARRDRARSVNLKTVLLKSAPSGVRKDGRIRDISAPSRF